MEFLYSIIKNGIVLVQLNIVDTAREGLEYFGGSAYIRYNQEGINNYEEAKCFEQKQETYYGNN